MFKLDVFVLLNPLRRWAGQRAWPQKVPSSPLERIWNVLHNGFDRFWFIWTSIFCLFFAVKPVVQMTWATDLTAQKCCQARWGEYASQNEARSTTDLIDLHDFFGRLKHRIYTVKPAKLEHARWSPTSPTSPRKRLRRKPLQPLQPRTLSGLRS